MGSETGGNNVKRRWKITGRERGGARCEGEERSSRQGTGVASSNAPPYRRRGYLMKPSSETAPVPDAIQTLMQTPISFR